MILHMNVLFAEKQKTLLIPIYDYRANLDPGKQQDTYSTGISRQINCQLIRASNSYPMLEAANSVKYLTPWKIAITLKKGLTFSNNQPVTAYDVVASYDYLEKHQNYLSNIAYWIEKMYATSNNEIIVELHNPASEFIQITALNDLPIYQKDFLAKAEKQPQLWKFPVTCGGYKIIKNDAHELALAPRFNGYPITYKKMGDMPIKKSEYQNFDIIDDYFIAANESPQGFRKVQVFAPYQIFLGLNSQKPRWHSKEQRCKFLAQMQADTVVESYGEEGQRANDLFPVGVIGYRNNYQFIEKIRENYPQTNKKIKLNDFCLAFLKLSVPVEHHSSYIKMVRNAIDTKNFHTEQITKVKDYTKLIKSSCDAMAIGFQTNTLEGYDFLVLFAKNGKNFTGLYNEEVSNALLNSQNLNDNKEKARQYQRIADIVRDECIVVPIVTIPMETFFIKDSLKAPDISKSAFESYYLGAIT